MNQRVIKGIKLIVVLFAGAFLLLGSADMGGLTANAGADQSISEGESVTLDASASTPDEGETLTGYKWSEGSKVYCENSKVCTIDNLSEGTHYISLIVTQSDGLTAGDSVKVDVKAPVPVNHAPTATPQNVTTNEDTAKAITLAGSDADGDSLSYAIVTNPTHGTLSGTAPNLTYTPAANYHGTDSFTFKANDGKADSAPATVNITVNAVNDAPTGVDDSAVTKLDETVNIAVLANDTDIDGDTLSITDSPSAPANGTAVVNADGKTIDYTPNPGFTGTDTFTYKPNDSHVNGAPVTVTVMVELPKSKVLKTGQTKCYDWDTYAEEECTEKHRGQDAYYAVLKGVGLERSYTRDDAKEIVTDNTTGLMWQDDSDAKTVRKPWVTQASYDAGNYYDTSGDTATTYCQNLTLGGFSDWRLPTIKELQTLPDFGRYDPAIDIKFQNTSTSCTYWSSTTLASFPSYAWFVYFGNGYSDYYHKTGNDGVRCARSGQ